MLLYTTDSKGNKTSQNIIGAQENVIATIRYSDEGQHVYFYNKDIRTSVTNVVDEAGSGVVSYQYDDYGNTKKYGSEDFYNEVCYTSGVYDEPTGFYYLNARYYNPENATFLTQDSYRGEKNDYGTWNLYAYCGENPINYVDPSGHNTIAAPFYTYGAANVWNATGWIALAAAGVITVGSIIYIGGQAQEVYKVRNVSQTQVRVKVHVKVSLLKKRLEVRTKGNENVKDTGLTGLSIDELFKRLRDPNTSNEDRKKIRAHLKAKEKINTRKVRNKAKSKKKGNKNPKHKRR